MNHLIIGLAVLVFGVFIGAVGLASAGIGIGIPMIPLGIYLSYRGWRIYKHDNQSSDKGSDDSDPQPFVPLERTKVGKIGLGILLILVGVGTSAMLIGIPIFFWGIWFLYKAYETELKKRFGREKG